MPLKGDKGMAVETQFGVAGAFEREGAISMIVHHLLGHRRALHASCLQRAYDHGLHPILPGGADLRSRMAKKLELQEELGSSLNRRGLAASCPLRFFGVINGAHCEPAGKWGRPMEWARILAYISGTVDQELLLRNEYLAAENQILRGQLKGRPKLSDAEPAKLEVSDQTVGNVLRRHGLPPAPERKHTTTWPAFFRTHLALLAGTDFSPRKC